MLYLEIEPEMRPEVDQMLVNTADWLMNESWAPSGGFVYITNSPRHYDKGGRGYTPLMLSEILALFYIIILSFRVTDPFDYAQDMFRASDFRPLAGIGFVLHNSLLQFV